MELLSVNDLEIRGTHGSQPTHGAEEEGGGVGEFFLGNTERFVTQTVCGCAARPACYHTHHQYVDLHTNANMLNYLEEESE